MVKPAIKSTGISKVLDAIAKKNFGRSRTESIIKNICVNCGKPATEFKDKISRKEFSISGLCSDCQDIVFKINNKRRTRYDPKQKSQER